MRKEGQKSSDGLTTGRVEGLRDGGVEEWKDRELDEWDGQEGREVKEVLVCY